MSSFEDLLNSLKSFHSSALTQKDLQIQQLQAQQLNQEIRQKRSDRQILKLAKQINSLKNKLMSTNASTVRPENVLVEKLTVENHLLFKKIGAEREAFENRIVQLRMEFESGVPLRDSYFDKELVDPEILGLKRNDNQGLYREEELYMNQHDQGVDQDKDNELSSHSSLELLSNDGQNNHPPSQDVFQEEENVNIDQERSFSNVSQTPLSSRYVAGVKCHSDPVVKKRIVERNDGHASTISLGSANYDNPGFKNEITEDKMILNPVSASNTPTHTISAKAQVNYSKTPISRVKPLAEQQQSGLGAEQILYEEIIPSSEDRVRDQQSTALANLSPNNPETPFKRKRELKNPYSLPIKKEMIHTASQTKSNTSQNSNASIPPKAIYSKTPITLTPTSTPTFAYNHVTRDKISRQQMHGDDCPCCSEYYRLTKDLPRLNKASTGAVQEVSRHRAWFKRPSTPPGFWDVHMASTQEIEEKQRLNEQE